MGYMIQVCNTSHHSKTVRKASTIEPLNDAPKPKVTLASAEASRQVACFADRDSCSIHHRVGGDVLHQEVVV